MPTDQQAHTPTNGGVVVPEFDIEQWVTESRAAQGLPATIQDDEALEKIALLVATPSTAPQGARALAETASHDQETSTGSR
jgi:hypothetical protein